MVLKKIFFILTLIISFYSWSQLTISEKLKFEIPIKNVVLEEMVKDSLNFQDLNNYNNSFRARNLVPFYYKPTKRGVYWFYNDWNFGFLVSYHRGSSVPRYFMDETQIWIDVDFAITSTKFWIHNMNGKFIQDVIKKLGTNYLFTENKIIYQSNRVLLILTIDQTSMKIKNTRLIRKNKLYNTYESLQNDRIFRDQELGGF